MGGLSGQGQQGPQPPQQQMGPPPPPEATGGKFRDWLRKDGVSEALMAMGANMLATGPSDMPVGFGTMLGKGAQAGTAAYEATRTRTAADKEKERQVKRQETQDRRATTTFGNTQTVFQQAQDQRDIDLEQQEKLRGLADSMDLTGMPDSMRQLMEYSVQKGDIGQALQTYGNWETQKSKLAADSKTGSGNLFSGDPQMDNAALMAESEFFQLHGRQPNLANPDEAQMMQELQMSKYSQLKSQEPRVPAFETESSKRQATRNDAMRTELAVARKTRDKLRHHNKIAMHAVDSGMATGPLSEAAHKIYNTAENFAQLVGLDENLMTDLKDFGTEKGIRQGAYDLFQQSFDRAAIDVTGDMSGQISNYELVLAGGTNVGPNDRPEAIRMVTAYKEIHYQHDDKREGDMYAAWDKASDAGEEFNVDKHLREWDRNNKLEAEYRDETGKLTGKLTPYGMKLEAIGIIRAKAPADGDRPDDDDPGWS